MVDALEGYGTVVTDDAPGHTKTLGHPFRMVEWLEAVENEISKHDKSILVGHSGGGHVAMLAAARRPERVQAVVVLDTPMEVRREFLLSDPVQDHFATYLEDPVLSDVVHFMVARDLDSLLDGFSEDAVDPRVSCPVLLVGADLAKGSLMTEEDIARAVSVLSDARAVRLDGLGHNLGIDTGDLSQLLEVLEPFLSEVATGNV